MNPTAAGAAKSKTIWLGLIITLMGYFQANLPLLRTLLAPSVGEDKVELVMGAINMALGVGVIVVRFYTDSALSEK